MRPYRIVQGETLRVEIEYKNASGGLVDLTPATTKIRIDLPTGEREFIGTTQVGLAAINVDRAVTATWRPGIYDIQAWVEWPEGEDVEAEVVYRSQIEVTKAI